MRRLLTAALALSLAAHADQRLSRGEIKTPAPLPKGSLLVVGFLGAWEDWDNPKRSVRKTALEIAARSGPGVYVETAGNHSRGTIRRFIVEALDANRNRKLEPEEAAAAELILYGQSFGAAAAVKLARELGRMGVPVRLTVQVDSVGRGDAVIPPNVRRALNLYQRDPGPIRGESRVRAADPSKTTLLGNLRFTYLFRDIDMSGYPWPARRLGVAHWKMDNDPAVWTLVETTILGEIAAWRLDQFGKP